MTVTMEQILGFENMQRVANTVMGGVPNVWGPEFLTIKGQPVVGNKAEWWELPNSRATPPTSNYGAAPREMDQVSASKRYAQCIHSYTTINHQMSVLTALRQMDNPALQARGQQWIDYQTTEAGRRYTNLRVSAWSSVFRYGAVYFDSNGNLLPSSSGAVVTVNMNVPANNQNQANGIIGTTWATDSTDILGDLTALSVAGVKASGFPLARAYYGANLPDYISTNAAVAAGLPGNQPLAEALSQNKIPVNFGIEGMDWRPLYNAFFEDSAGTVQDWFIGDSLVLMPTPAASWMGIIEGSFEVPDGAISIAGTAAQAAASMRSITGYGTYARVTDKPPGVEQTFVDTFLPTLFVPASIFILDVVP